MPGPPGRTDPADLHQAGPPPGWTDIHAACTNELVPPSENTQLPGSSATPATAAVAKKPPPPAAPRSLHNKVAGSAAGQNRAPSPPPGPAAAAAAEESEVKDVEVGAAGAHMQPSAMRVEMRELRNSLTEVSTQMQPLAEEISSLRQAFPLLAQEIAGLRAEVQDRHETLVQLIDQFRAMVADRRFVS